MEKIKPKLFFHPIYRYPEAMVSPPNWMSKKITDKFFIDLKKTKEEIDGL